MKIRGNTIGTTTPRPDWNQSNPKRADYILNKPENADIVCDASGEVISTADASNRLLKGLTIYGKTTQNGTPTPDAPVPLVSAGDGGGIEVNVNGRNIIKHIEVGGNATTNGDTITIGAFGDAYFFVIPYSIPDGTVVTLSFDAGAFSGTLELAIYNELDKVITVAPNSRNTFTFAYRKNIHDGRILVDDRARTVENVTISNIQLAIGTVATAYDSSAVQTLSIATPNGLPGIPVSSGGNYTDTSGQQWICDEVDLARGVYVQRVMQTTFDGSADEGWFTYGEATADGLSFVTSPANTKIGAMLSLCDKYQNITGAWSAEHKGMYGIYSDHFTVTNKYFRPPNSTVATFAQWIAWLAENPLKFICAMETPIETPLDADTLAAYAALHTYKPNTTVLNNAGAGQKVAYVADTKTYIDNKFTTLLASIAQTASNKEE